MAVADEPPVAAPSIAPAPPAVADEPPVAVASPAPPPGPVPGPPQPAAPAAASRFRLRTGTTLRQHAARGTLVNAVFNTALTGLGFLKGFVLAAFLTPSDYGVWGILLISLGTLTWLKQVGIADKYIQQDEADQELAFHRAFTMELIVNAALLALLLVAVPLMALVYGRPELLLPGFVLCLIIPGGQLQVPFWVLYRKLEFAQQRRLQIVDPLVAFVGTVALAIAGAGYWSLVVGTLVGTWAGAWVAITHSPYRLRLAYDAATLRSYVSFSTPLFVASLGGIVIAQGSIFFSESAIGLVGAGAVTLAAQVSVLAQRVDDVVSGTLYPVVCAVRDRRDLLYETFEKSNRIALMWGMPFGFGLALFAGDFVHFVIGARWAPAIVVLRATGVAAALQQLGFNWTSYVRALGDTKPIAVNSLVQAVVFLGTVPLLYAYGLDGYAVAVLALTAATLVVRGAYLARIFDGFAIARHAVRALSPSVPAIAVVLLVRLADGAQRRTLPLAVGELALYVLVTGAATWIFERSLLEEAVGYLRRRQAAAAPAA